MVMMLILLLAINLLMILIYKWSIRYEGPVAVPIPIEENTKSIHDGSKIF